MVVTGFETPGNDTVPVGLSAALVAGLPVLTVVVAVTLWPRIMLLGFDAADIVVG